MTQNSARQQTGPTTVVITCEHGGHKVPAAYRELFCNHQDVLQGHRGWDIGALRLARRFADQLQAPLYESTVTRLLVELNRSLHHPALFSEFTSALPPVKKMQILNQHWHPYRTQVESHLAALIAEGHSVLHLSVHSFVPILNGQVRRTDIGLLYDPGRSGERQFCGRWQAAMRQAVPHLTVHRNSPYRGIADGFVTYLRKQFPDAVYAGLELEVKHSLLQADSKSGSSLASKLIHCFQQTLIPEAEEP